MMAIRKFRPHSWLVTVLLLLVVAPFQKPGSYDSPALSSALLANALPVTSKPIDGSPQNAAWGDWVVLTAAQQQNTKSRKVTPKSIFTLPFRQCPEGHTLSDSRCIPVVQIDNDQMLKDQLSLLGGSDSSGNNGQPIYDYGDYGDDGGEQMPLKVSIFQKFPAADYPAEGSGSGPLAVMEAAEPSAPQPALPAANETTDPIAAPVINVTQFLQQISDYLERYGRLPTNDSLFGEDLNAASSQITTTATQPPEEGFSIDAIVVPAGGPRGETAADLEPQRAASQLHRVSLFKDVQQQDIASLLKVDSLLPLRSANLTQSSSALRLEQPQSTGEPLLLGLGDESADSTVSPTTTADKDETDSTDFQMDDSFFSASSTSDQSLTAGGEVTQPHEHEALRLAAEEERQRRRGGQHMVLKKSKVEPVGEQEPHVAAADTSTASPPAPTSPLPAATLSDGGDATANRFHYQHEAASSAAGLGNAVTETGASTATTMDTSPTPTSTTAATSFSTGEINIEQELRAINQLVKGKRQQDGKTAATSENTTTDGEAKQAGQQVTTEATEATTIRIISDEEKTTMVETEPSSSTVSDTTSAVTDDEITSPTTMMSDGDADTTSSPSSTSVSLALSPSSPEATETATTTSGGNSIGEENATTMSSDETATSSMASGPAAESTDSTTMSTAEPTKMESIRDGNEISSSVDPSTTTPSPAPATPTIWSKIMPILGFASTPDGLHGEKPSKRITADDMGTSLLFTFRGNSVGAVEQDVQPSVSSRRNRNSKIRKFDEVPLTSTTMDEESSSVDSTVDSGHQERASTVEMASTMFLETSTTSQTTQTTTTAKPTTTATPTTTPPSSTSSPTTITAESSDYPVAVDSYEPFWWLPLGWSLSGSPPSVVETSETDSLDSEVLPPDDSSLGGEEPALDSNSLLLRLWSSLPGNNIRAKA